LSRASPRACDESTSGRTRRRDLSARMTCESEPSGLTKRCPLGRSSQRRRDRNRAVRLMATLATDLAEWWLASGRPDGAALVFPTRDGGAWRQTHYQNWRRRRFNEAAKTAGLSGVTPYTLRHSFASLLLAEQLNIAEVAVQRGHSPRVLLSTYAHVIDDLRGREGVNAEDEIRAAKAGAVPPDVVDLLPAAATSSRRPR